MDAPSDLIVDVTRAADPQKAAAVAQRLAALGDGAGTGPADFASALSATDPAAGEARVPTLDARSRLEDPALAAAHRASKAREQFEATLLNSFIGEMMPKDTTESFGGGYAGDMWRSLLSEKIADQIAKSGTLGIAGRVFDNGHSPALAKLEHAAAAGTTGVQATVASSNPLSLPADATAADGAYLFARDKSI